jgi:hypothetical protein
MPLGTVPIAASDGDRRRSARLGGLRGHGVVDGNRCPVGPDVNKDRLRHLRQVFWIERKLPLGLPSANSDPDSVEFQGSSVHLDAQMTIKCFATVNSQRTMHDKARLDETEF